MGLENGFAEQQKTPEQFPSQENIRSAFETILDGKEYTELRLLSDKEGVSLYEIEVVLENGEKRQIFANFDAINKIILDKNRGVP